MTDKKEEFERSSNKYKLYATVTTGLEFVAGQEVEEKLNATVYYDRKSFPGRIIFSVPAVTDELILKLTKLQTVEHVYAYVGEVYLTNAEPHRFVLRQQKKDEEAKIKSEGTTQTSTTEGTLTTVTKEEVNNPKAEQTPTESTTVQAPADSGKTDSEATTTDSTDKGNKREREAEDKDNGNKKARKQMSDEDRKRRGEVLEDLRKAATDKFSQENWQYAIELWQAYERVIRGIKNKELLNSPIFRVSGKTAGDLLFNCVELGTLLAESITKKFPSWSTKLKGFEMDVLAYCRFGTLFVGLSVTHTSLSLQQVNPSRTLGATALRPAIAYAIAQMARIKPGEVAIDPMVGCGTIPQLASQNWPNAMYFAGDNADVAIEKTKKNQDSLKSGFVDVFKWDGRKLPFADNSVDVIFTDMPFGKRIGSHSGNVNLYPSILKEFNRILKMNTGRAVLLTAENRLIIQEVNKSKLWYQERQITINQGGLDVSIFLLIKNHDKLKKITPSKEEETNSSATIVAQQ